MKVIPDSIQFFVRRAFLVPVLPSVALVFLYVQPEPIEKRFIDFASLLGDRADSRALSVLEEEQVGVFKPIDKCIRETTPTNTKVWVDSKVWVEVESWIELPYFIDENGNKSVPSGSKYTSKSTPYNGTKSCHRFFIDVETCELEEHKATVGRTKGKWKGIDNQFTITRGIEAPHCTFIATGTTKIDAESIFLDAVSRLPSWVKQSLEVLFKQPFETYIKPSLEILSEILNQDISIYGAAPSIEYILRLEFPRDPPANGKVKISGSHDRFPSYRFRVNEIQYYFPHPWIGVALTELRHNPALGSIRHLSGDHDPGWIGERLEDLGLTDDLDCKFGSDGYLNYQNGGQNNNIHNCAPQVTADWEDWAGDWHVVQQPEQCGIESMTGGLVDAKITQNIDPCADNTRPLCDFWLRIEQSEADLTIYEIGQNCDGLDPGLDAAEPTYLFSAVIEENKVAYFDTDYPDSRTRYVFELQNGSISGFRETEQIITVETTESDTDTYFKKRTFSEVTATRRP